jgi:hypothetical protein
MRTTHRTFIIAGAFVAIALAAVSAGIAFGPILAANDDDFDRSKCLSYCRDTYIGEWYSNPGGEDWETHWRGRGSYEGTVRMYQRCVMDCEKKFWDKFDKDTE